MTASQLEVTGLRAHRAWQERAFPPVERVTDRVWSVPVPVPDSPIRYTFCYLLMGDDDAVVVDPGWDSQQGWESLIAGLRDAGVDPSEIGGIVVTHIHPDHHGLSARLAAVAPDAWIGMMPADAVLLRDEFVQGRPRAEREWLFRQGVGPEEIAEVETDPARFAAFAAMASPTRNLADDSMLPLSGRRIRVIATPGHTPGHLCLYDEDENLLLTGDHVLPRISPNVGLQPFTADPPLGPYLRSLERIRSYDDAEVLPAHEWRFRGLSSRVDQLLAHHQERCEEILSVLALQGPLSPWGLTTRLTWSRPWDQVRGFQRRAALAETRAHIEYLAQLSRVEVRGDESDPIQVFVR